MFFLKDFILIGWQTLHSTNINWSFRRFSRTWGTIY